MNNNLLKLTIKLLYILFLLIPAYVIFKNTDIALALSDLDGALYLLLRLSGLYAFFLIFLMIIHGALMPIWQKIFDAKTTVFHEKIGIWAYSLILVHPLSYFSGVFLASGLEAMLQEIPPSAATVYDLGLTSGKVALTLLTISIFAAYFRHKGFLNRYWLLFHLLNYVVFGQIYLHSKQVGSDMNTPPLNMLVPAMVVVVAAATIYRMLPRLLKIAKKPLSLVKNV